MVSAGALFIAMFASQGILYFPNFSFICFKNNYGHKTVIINQIIFEEMKL